MNFKLNTKHAILKCASLLCAAFLLFFSNSAVEARAPGCGGKTTESPSFLNGLKEVEHHSSVNLQSWFDSMFFASTASAEKLHVLDIDLNQDFELDYDIQHIGSHESPSAPPIADTLLPVKEYIQYFDSSAGSLIETGDQFLLNLLLPGHDGNSVGVSIEKTHPANYGPATNVLVITPKDKALPLFEEKVFEIDPSVDTNKISATFDKGILSITAPKNQEKVERFDIKISGFSDANSNKNEDEKKAEKKSEKIDTPVSTEASKAGGDVSSGIEIIDDVE